MNFCPRNGSSRRIVDHSRNLTGLTLTVGREHEAQQQYGKLEYSPLLDFSNSHRRDPFLLRCWDSLWESGWVYRRASAPLIATKLSANAVWSTLRLMH